MKTSWMLVAALSLAVVGCKKKGSEAPAGNDCAKAINNSMALSKAEMEQMGVTPELMQKLVNLGVQRCTEDTWSPEAIKCMVDAKAMDAAQACYGKLTQEQRDKMEKAAAAFAEPSEGSAAPDVPVEGEGSAADGSAADSDTTGSGT